MVWQDTQSYIRPQPLWSYKKATVRRRPRRQAETGRNAVAAQVWQAVSLLSLHLHTSISSSIMVMTTSDWLPSSTDFFIGCFTILFVCLVCPQTYFGVSPKTFAQSGWTKKRHTCPGRTSSQRYQPWVESRSWSQSFCQTAAGRRRGRCTPDSSGSPRHGRPPLWGNFMF